MLSKYLSVVLFCNLKRNNNGTIVQVVGQKLRCHCQTYWQAGLLYSAIMVPWYRFNKSPDPILDQKNMSSIAERSAAQVAL